MLSRAGRGSTGNKCDTSLSMITIDVSYRLLQIRGMETDIKLKQIIAILIITHGFISGIFSSAIMFQLWQNNYIQLKRGIAVISSKIDRPPNVAQTSIY